MQIICFGQYRQSIWGISGVLRLILVALQTLQTGAWWSSFQLWQLTRDHSWKSESIFLVFLEYQDLSSCVVSHQCRPCQTLWRRLVKSSQPICLIWVYCSHDLDVRWVGLGRYFPFWSHAEKSWTRSVSPCRRLCGAALRFQMFWSVGM